MEFELLQFMVEHLDRVGDEAARMAVRHRLLTLDVRLTRAMDELLAEDIDVPFYFQEVMDAHRECIDALRPLVGDRFDTDFERRSDHWPQMRVPRPSGR
jgi:hypothetical protein